MFKPVDEKMNFPLMEKKWLKYWYENNIVNQYIKKNKNSSKYFSFLDGPITANNPMGIHHAWGRTYKDLWPRFYNLLGYKQRFQNGFDCQGLWVEVEVEKELGLKSKKEIENLIPGDRFASIAKFIDLCKKRVLKYSAIQTEQSKRLGYFADWEHSYFTMSDENNYMIWYFLKKCYENGWIYKGRESVPWCPRCETAISQHEMLTEDYKELVHDSVYFSLPIIGRKNENLLVWTTTPWTIPANIAVAIDKDFDYSLVETEGNKYWLAKDRIKEVFKAHKVYKVKKIVKGKELVGLKYQGPFDNLPAVKKVAEKNPDKFHTIFATDQKILPIITTEGTGMVHTAVSAGTEDFKMGKKLGLPMIPVIKDNADYLPGLGFLTGKNAKKHPEIILDYLKSNKNYNNLSWVFNIVKYQHRYPACWRCKTELVWKVADEWYIAMDRSPLQVQSSKFKVQSRRQNIKTLRQRMIEVAKKIKWMPEFGLDRELDWLKNMHDWLISKKNRYWGLALPIYECKKCGNFEVIGSKEELKKRALKGWEKFEGHSPHKPYIDEVKIKCSGCGELVSRVDDVGNPWLDAGIVSYSTITENNQGKPLYLKDKKAWRKWFPADFITESFPGQFKNWFYALIAQSTVLENKPPFKRVLGFGTLLGEDGRPMHKSWGNAIEFNEGADKIGVDVMRWMYCRHNPAENLLFGYKKANEVRRQFYLMLWNVYRFFVEYVNLDGFHPKKAHLTNFQASNKENILDKWILKRFSSTVLLVERNLKEFNAKDAVLELEKFVSDLSTWYIRRSRSRLWLNSDNKEDKEKFYQTIYFVLVNLSIVLSPFLPFISEEIYTNLTGKQSVHLESWPSINLKFKIKNSRLMENMDLVRKIVEIGHRIRKELKLKLRQPLALVTIEINSLLPLEFHHLLADELNVKRVIIKKNKKIKEIKLSFDTQLTPKLLQEGQLRELVRQIQWERKKLGIRPDQKISLVIPEKFLNDEDYLKKRVLCSQVTAGNSLKIKV